MTTTLTLSISDYCAWAPGVSSTSDWEALFASGQSPAPDEKPDLSFLPPMQRRRLSPLARAAFSVMNNLDVKNPTYTPTIFCSQFGESQRTYKILEDIAQDEDMSPTAFSLSVHNAISGQTSIQFKNKAPISAIGVDDHGYLNALLDAIGQLDQYEEVVVVFYEESQPEFYDTQKKTTPFPCACAMLITRASLPNSQSYKLSFDPEQSSGTGSGAPQILSLVQFIQSQLDELQLGQWQLTRQ